MRLVLDNLDAIALHYRMLADEGRYPDARNEAEWLLYSPTDAWDANKRTLAAELWDDEGAHFLPPCTARRASA
jgi:hypothetical protein